MAIDRPTRIRPVVGTTDSLTDEQLRNFISAFQYCGKDREGQLRRESCERCSANRALLSITLKKFIEDFPFAVSVACILREVRSPLLSCFQFQPIFDCADGEL
jgi:hypothetical protein